jgi:hypothetical protein
MKINNFGKIDHSYFNDFVVHFTGRRGPSHRASGIKSMSDWSRLKNIITNSILVGSEMPPFRDSAVCFTEATADGCSWLIGEGRYTSCGIAFNKRDIFEVGGGPVLQVRGDEWGVVRNWPVNLRSRAVRLWPGAIAEVGEALPLWLESRSEWLFEREWRVPTPNIGFQFTLDQVAFLVIPSLSELRNWVRELSTLNLTLAGQVASMRYVVISGNGIVESSGVRRRNGPKSLSSGEPEGLTT